MNWNTLTREEKVAWLVEQQTEIRRITALLERFEQVTQQWLDKAKAPEPQKKV